MSTFPFSDKSATDVDQWFNVQQKSGHLANYLLDPKEFFNDGVTSKLTETMVFSACNKIKLVVKKTRE